MERTYLRHLSESIPNGETPAVPAVLAAGTKAPQIEPSVSLFGDLAKESYGVD